MDTSNEIKLQEEYIKKVKKINQDKNLKYTILTMGCQLNENDSEKLCGMLEKMGYTKTEKQNDADLALFNTCCVRENAEDKLFGKLGELKRLKEQKGIIIAIGGCMMQEKHITDKIKESYPFVDILFGTHTLHKFPEDLYKVIKEKRKLEDILDIDGKIYEGLPIKRDSKIKASVTIMNGCNNFCSYCIVPYVRGRERSRQPRDIIEEVKKLAKEGYKEITLLGQNVNSYLRVEREKNIPFEEYQGVNSFATLLRAINKIDGINESFVFGKQVSEDKENVKIYAKLVFDREKVEEIYKTKEESEIYKAIFEKIKEINSTMPKYKAIKGIILTEKPLIKTTTNKIKRQENLDAIG